MRLIDFYKTVVEQGIEADPRGKSIVLQELKKTAEKYKTLKPEEVKFVQGLPKTRSAKIVRGVIKNKYLNKDLGNITSVENPDTIEYISQAI